MSEDPLYKCEDCEYSTRYKHNLLRHQRNKHRVVELPSDYEEEVVSNPPPPQKSNNNKKKKQKKEEEEDDDITYNDLEDIISDKINSVLEKRDLPKISKQATQTAMKTFMNSNVATLCCGMCLGYLITSNAPILLSMLRQKNGQFPISSDGGKVLQQQEMMKRMMMMQQAQAQAQAQAQRPATAPSQPESDKVSEDCSQLTSSH